MEFDPLKDVANKTVKSMYVERIAYEVGAILPKHTPLHVDVHEQIGINSDGFTALVRMYLFGKSNSVVSNKNDTTVVLEETKVPSTWVDAIKERFFPEWLLKKFPCDYRIIPTIMQRVTNITETRMCPHLSHKKDIVHVSWINSNPGTVSPMPPAAPTCPNCGHAMVVDDIPVQVCENCGYYKGRSY